MKHQEPTFNPAAMGSAPADEEKSMPLGVGEFAAEEGAIDPLGGGGARKKFNSGVFVIVFVIAAAAGGLFFMRSLTRVKVAAAGSTDIELTIEKFLKTLKGSDAAGFDAKSAVELHDAALDVLTVSYTEQQVALTDVQCNPFILPGEGGGPTIPTGPSPDPNDGLRSRRVADLKMKMEEAGARFQLKSVIMGDDPLANVSGKIVRVGDVIETDDEDIEFSVVAITTSSAVLRAENEALAVSVDVTLRIKRNN